MEKFEGTEQKEGFALEVILKSELTDGSIVIDGAYTFDVTYGDWCKIDIKPEYALKCIKFMHW